MPLYQSQRLSASTQLADMIIHTLMDPAFNGEYSMTPMLHSHPCYELLCCVSENAGFRVEFADGAFYEIPSQSVCLLPPKIYHQTVSDNGAARKLAFQLFYQKTESQSNGKIYDSFHDSLSRQKEPLLFSSPEICRMMIGVRNEFLAGAPGMDEMVNALISELYITLWRKLNRSPEPIKNRSERTDNLQARYLQIEQLLAESQLSHMTAETVAARLGLSKRQMNRIFRSLYGMSFHQKLIEQRMEYAAYLLGTTDISIEAIGERCGYLAASGFYIAFRQYYGIAPSEYREQAYPAFKNGN